jgi:chromate transport protein ChrA
MNWSRKALFALVGALLLAVVFWIARSITRFPAYSVLGSGLVILAMVVAVRAITGPSASDKLIRNYRITRTVPVFLFGVALLLNNDLLVAILIGGAVFVQLIVVRRLRGKLWAHLEVSK